ncbi:MAG TPA: hypothetical protein ENI05_09400 [Porticoccus sp.]|nr:hypothetical protein [Porticoccus sp.]
MKGVTMLLFQDVMDDASDVLETLVDDKTLPQLILIAFVFVALSVMFWSATQLVKALKSDNDDDDGDDDHHDTIQDETYRVFGTVMSNMSGTIVDGMRELIAELKEMQSSTIAEHRSMIDTIISLGKTHADEKNSIEKEIQILAKEAKDSHRDIAQAVTELGTNLRKESS